MNIPFMLQLAKNRKILASSMTPVPAPAKYPASSPMLARAKFLTSRSRKPIEAQAGEPNETNGNGNKLKPEDNVSTDSFESADNSNKRNIIDRIRSVVSSSPQNVSTNFQPVLPPPTTANKIGRFFSLKSGGFFGGKSNLMDTVPSGSNTSLNSLNDTKDRTIKNKKHAELEAKKLQEQEKKGLRRKGSFKENKFNAKDTNNDNQGNEKAMQNNEKSARRQGGKQSGAFYTLNKTGNDNIKEGSEGRKVPGGIINKESAKGNNKRYLGEKESSKEIEGVSQDTKLEKVGEIF